MTTRTPTPGAVAVILVFALSVFGFTVYTWRSFGGSTPLQPQGYRVQVSFGAGGTQLFRNADVRIAGVHVGRVRIVRPTGRRTEAVLELERRFAPLAADARAILRTKTLLGETFVSLTPGSRNARPIADGGRLAAAQVEDPQPVDRVLSTFDPPTRARLRRFLVGFSDALAGRGGDLNATFGSLAPLSAQVRRLSETLARRQPQLRGLVVDTATTLDAMAATPAALRRLVRSGAAVLTATGARDRRLAATIRALPGTLRQTRATLRVAEAAAHDVGPTLRTLRPVARRVAPALDEARRTLPALARTARGIVPAADAARRGLPATTRVVDRLGPLLATLSQAGRDLVPVLETLAAYRRDIVSGLATSAAATQGSFAGRRYLRVLFLLFNESVLGYERKLGSSRSNPYARPGALDDLARGGLKSLSCANTGNPQTVPVLGPGAPPCREQGPWTLRGRTALLPAPARDAP